MTKTTIATVFPDEDDDRRQRPSTLGRGWWKRIPRFLPRFTSPRQACESLIQSHEDAARSCREKGDEQGAAYWQACAGALRRTLNFSAPTTQPASTEPADHWPPPMRRRPSIARSCGVLPSLRCGALLISISVMLTIAVPAFATLPPKSHPRIPSLQSATESRLERALSRSVVEIATPVARGTGVYAVVDNHHLLITAEHVLRDGKRLLSDSVRFRGYSANPNDPNEWRNLTEVSPGGIALPEIDLAIILLDQPLEGHVAARLATDEMKIGQQVIGFGFADPHGAPLRGVMTGFDTNGERFLSLRLPVMPGDSGGPLFDARTGLLIGIVSSQADPRMSGDYECRPMSRVMRCTTSLLKPPMNATAIAVNLISVIGKLTLEDEPDSADEAAAADVPEEPSECADFEA